MDAGAAGVLGLAGVIGGIAVGALFTTPPDRQYLRWPLTVVVVAALVCAVVVVLA